MMTETRWIRSRTVTALAVALTIGLAACASSEDANESDPVVENATESVETALPVDDGSSEPAPGDSGGNGSIRTVVGDIDYQLSGFECDVGENEFGPTALMFLSQPIEGYTALYSFSPQDGSTTERLTVTGPDGNLFLEHRQLDGEVMNTQTQMPGAFLFDVDNPALDFDTEALFTVASATIEFAEMDGTVQLKC